MENIFFTVATIASVALVFWALLMSPGQASGKSGEPGDGQLTTFLLAIIVLAAVIALIVFALPYLAIAALVALGVVVLAVVGYVLVKFLRPLLPRIFRMLRRLLEFLWRNIPRVLRAVLRVLRNAGRLILKFLRWVVRPSRWKRLVQWIINAVRRVTAALLSAVRRMVTSLQSRTRRSGHHALSARFPATTKRLTEDDALPIAQGGHPASTRAPAVMVRGPAVSGS